MKKFGSNKPKNFGPSDKFKSNKEKPRTYGGSPFAPFRKKPGQGKPYGSSEGSGGSDRPYKSDRDGGFESGEPKFRAGSGRFGGGQGKKGGFGKSGGYGSDRKKPGGYGQKREFGNRPGSGGGYGKKTEFGDRPRKSFEDKPQYGDRTDSGSFERKPKFGDRPRGGFGDKPDYGNRPRTGGGFGQKRDFSDRPRKSFGDKPQYGDRRESGGYGGKPKFGDRPRGGFGQKPSFGDRPRGGFGQKPAYGDRPHGGFQKERFDDAQNFNSTLSNRPYRNDSEEQDFHEFSDVSAGQNRAWTRTLAGDPDDLGGVVSHDREDAPFAYRLIVSMKETRNVPVKLVWVFDTMVAELPDGEPSPGSTVYVHDSKNKFLGAAIYNPHSRIRARIFSQDKVLFDYDYIGGALKKAVALRRETGCAQDQGYRVVFGESDGLPGLVADYIGGILVIQALTYAVNKHLTYITDSLNELIGPDGIVVRNDVPIRVKEGLETGAPIIHGEIPERVRVVEDGCVMFANPAGGQKTGLFLDQRQNRESIRRFSPDARVLDLFCHVGGWGLRAAKYGASEVVCVDSSRPALDLARAAAEENGFSFVRFEEADVFDYLNKAIEAGDEKFDIIVCDPPAFAKTRQHFEEAFRAYLSLNYRAMKLLKPGGVLVSCTCSQAVSSEDFDTILATASRNARMQFQMLERRGAPADHPVLVGLPETDYLKCYVLKHMAQ